MLSVWVMVKSVSWSHMGIIRAALAFKIYHFPRKGGLSTDTKSLGD